MAYGSTGCTSDRRNGFLSETSLPYATLGAVYLDFHPLRVALTVGHTCPPGTSSIHGSSVRPAIALTFD